MGKRAQLEIIGPDGAVFFAPLDPTRGITNIGRDPENDVVLESPEIADFHAVIDHREAPFRILVFAEDSTRLDGEYLSPDGSATLGTWSTLEIDGHTLILIEGAETGGGPETAPVEARQTQAAASATTTAPPAARRTPPPPVTVATPERAAPPPTPARVPREPTPRLPSRPADVTDDVILTDISQREWTVNVEETATFTVEMINGGPIVATFVVHVEGVPQEWVTLSPPDINLNEEERGTVTVTVTPPRHPSSRAGAHNLAVVITSPDHPGRASQRGATLTINPYYAFAASDLDPKQQTVGGANPRGTATIHIANKGNSEVPFRLEATDNQRACTFEFEVPGEPTPLAQQAEIRLPPEETFVIPMHITPLRRPFIGLRKQRHTYTATVSMLTEEQIPRSMLGEILVRPLIGPLLMALIALLLGALVILLFRPRIHEFDASAREIEAGDEVIFTYDTSALARRWVETDEGTLITLDTAEGTYVTAPEEDTLYTLHAENLLSRVIGLLSPEVDPIPIDVSPLEPKIIVFTVDRPFIIAGQTATLRWEVVNANNVVLVANGQEQTLAPAEYTAEREVEPQETTDYTLRATNEFGGQAVDSLSIEVKYPTPTPLPMPVIQRFSISPRTIYAGESVTLTWETENTTKVEILGEEFPPNGETVQTLNQVGVVEYVLIALYDDEMGIQQPARRTSAPVRVTVLEKPSPTPEPEKPEIEEFRAVPAEVVRDSGQQVQLVWSVTGEFTNIEITGPTVGTLSNLAAKGSIPVNATETTFFMLTAYNDELNSSATTELTVTEPPPPTPTPLPEPIIQYFELQDADTNDEYGVTEVSGSGTTRIYSVDQNAAVVFRWSALNIPQVVLIAGDDSSNREPVGTFNTVISQAGEYQLVAANEAGVARYAYIQVNLNPVEVPPAPYDLDVDTPALPGQPFDLVWSYDPNHIDDIIGFRIYRAQSPSGPWNRIADETTLNNTDRTWTEEDPRCGMYYYVAAVYVDIDGNKQETAPSPNQWGSWPCPTPTP
ncbi:MAG: FHA domain-containing protein [Anaerolineales bacterium]